MNSQPPAPAAIAPRKRARAGFAPPSAHSAPRPLALSVAAAG